MTVLVTGGAGYIGSHTVRQLLVRGHDVTVFDNLSAGHREAVPAERLVVGDLAMSITSIICSSSIASRRWSTSPHLQVGESVADPAKYYHQQHSTRGHLIDCCRRSRAPANSSSPAPARSTAIPTRCRSMETRSEAPINRPTAYQADGRACPCRLRRAHDPSASAPSLLQRGRRRSAGPSGTIGEDHDPETHLIPVVLQVALGKRSHLDLFGTDYPTPDGTCIRDYIHVDDLARAHSVAIEKLRPATARVQRRHRQGLQCS